MNWYYAINGQRQGPVAQSEIENLASSGVITEQTLVWKEGMEGWKPYGMVRPSPSPAPVPPAGPSPFAGGVSEDTAVCVVSGRTFPKRDMVNYEGKWVGAPYREEFFRNLQRGPTGGVGPVPGPFGYAGFWQRFCAKFIDAVCLYVISIPVNMMVASRYLGTTDYFNYQPNFESEEEVAAYLLYFLVSMFASTVIGMTYALFFIRRFQATPGKMVLGLKLVRSDGSALTGGRIIGRSLAEMLSGLMLGIGYLIAAFDDQKKALHDQICDTRVIRTR